MQSLLRQYRNTSVLLKNDVGLIVMGTIKQKDSFSRKHVVNGLDGDILDISSFTHWRAISDL